MAEDLGKEAFDKFFADPEAFISELEKTSDNFGGKLFGRLDLIDQQQQKYRNIIATHRKPLITISNAWESFFLETVSRINLELLPKCKDNPVPYAYFTERLNQLFRALCAVRLVGFSGYPNQSFAMLRNVFDSALLLGAIADGHTDVFKVDGLGSGAIEIARVARRKEEKAVRAKILAHLSTEARQALKYWNDFFDDETHGGFLSRLFATDYLMGNGLLPVTPHFAHGEFMQFAHFYLEFTWLVHRLIPLIQQPHAYFAPDWATKWQLIDNHFCKINSALSFGSHEPIGKALEELRAILFSAKGTDCLNWAPAPSPT